MGGGGRETCWGCLCMVEYSVDSTDVNTVPEGSRADHVEARNSDVFRLLLMCSLSIIDYIGSFVQSICLTWAICSRAHIIRVSGIIVLIRSGCQVVVLLLKR